MFFMPDNPTNPASDNGFKWRIKEWFPDLSDAQLLSLKGYADELVKFTGKINLISARTIHALDQIHFADSILAFQVVKSKVSGLGSAPLYDFGSGNGFPGLVFAILEPSIQFLLVDSDQRKCEFLKSTASRLGLKNVKVLNQAIETLPPKSVLFGVSRGYADISNSLMSLKPIFDVGGTLIHLKGPEWGVELTRVPSQLFSVWRSQSIGDYKIPEGGHAMVVISSIKLID